MNQPWSAYLYLAGDNNLVKTVEEDLAEISKADPDKVNVAVQVDRPRVDTERKFLTSGGFFLPFPSGLKLNGNVDSGAAKVLSAFLRACRVFKPADYTAVVLYGHGGPVNFRVNGTNGNGTFLTRLKTFLFGGITDAEARDFLTFDELFHGFFDALEGGRNPFSIIGCDACLMGSLEIAHQLRSCGRYFIASQDNEETAGWPYEHVLNSLADLSPKDAAKAIVATYDAATAADPDATLSAIDLGHMNDLASALNRLGGELLPLIPAQMKAVAQAREYTRTFANYDYIDLSGFAQALQKSFGAAIPNDPRLKTIGDAIKGALDIMKDMVVATTKPGQNSGAYGLSIYLPNEPVGDEYHKLSLSKESPQWHDFVEKYGQNR